VFGVLEARAGGLPFVVEELLAGLITRGSLVAQQAGWQLRDERRVDVPMSFAQSISDRLAGLSTRDRRVINLAAILGRDFDWSHLPRIVGATEADVLESLARAVQVQLVDETGGGRFQFRHSLTVDAILDGMIEPYRARLAAAALDTLTAGPEPVAPELLQLAAHLSVQAGRPVEASRYLTEDARVAIGRALIAELDAHRAPADRRAAVRLLLAKAALATHHLLVTLQLRRAEKHLLASLQRAEEAALT
jgi:hypothetical protein